MARLLISICIAILLATTPLLAEEEVATGKFAVSFVAEEQQRPWLVNALEKNIYNDLSGYARVSPVTKAKNEADTCPNRSTTCLLKLYQELGIDALMLGQVDDSYIEYQVYDVFEESLVKTGSIQIGTSSTLLKLRMGAFSAFKPFLEKGGILDQRKFKASIAADQRLSNSENVASFMSSYRDIFFVSLAIFICLPYFLTLIGRPLKHSERSFIVTRWFLPFLFIGMSAISYQYAIEFFKLEDIIGHIIATAESYQWMFAAFGGGAWGYFLILNMKVIVPNLQGIERIKQNTLFPLIKAFLVTLAIKFLLVTLFYFCYFYGIYVISQDFGFSQEAVIIFVLPLTGLFICYWIALLLEVFSMSIDMKLADGEISYNSLTHIKVKKYFIGYLKRNGVTLNKNLVENIVFIPGKNKGVLCYGGGLSRPRIVIEKQLIEFAIAPDDVRKLIKPTYRYSNGFNLIPSLKLSEKKRTLFSMSDQRREENINRYSSFFNNDLRIRKKNVNSRIESAKGVILPEFEEQDDLPSLMSDNLDDMLIVEALLLEDAQLNEPYDEDAEIDDASMDDKDFLFGILLHKFGGLLRHEHVFTTFYFYFFYKVGAKKKSYNFPFSRYFSVVADTFVVLNFGLHHLMQHLYYQVNNNIEYLTTRLMSNSVLESQDMILTGVKKTIDERKPKLSRTDEYDRIVWLSQFCPHPLGQRKSQKLKIYLKWVFTLFVVSLVAWVGFDSYEYRPIYREIIDNEKQAIQEAIEKAKEDEREEK